jgi:LysR family transcriptional regulator, cyn operon transcriptional activator
MELRHLRYFAALAEELSFTRAAARVHVTQSTLSHQIKQLEAEIGSLLFHRVGKRVVMTEAGQTLLANVVVALKEIDTGIRAIKNCAKPLIGELRISSTHTFNISLIPACLAAFLERHPSASVLVQELSSAAVETELAAGNVDLGVAYYPTNRAGLVFEPLYHEEMVLAVAQDHPLGERKRIRLSELHRQRLGLSTKSSRTRQMLDESFRSVNAEPIVVAEMDSTAAILSLVRRSEIAAIVSERAASEVHGISIVALESPTPLRTPGLLWRKDGVKSPQALSFAAIIRETVLSAHLKLPKSEPARD